MISMSWTQFCNPTYQICRRWSYFLVSLGKIYYQYWFTQRSQQSELVSIRINIRSWWRHQMGTFSALLAICARNSPVTGELPSQGPVRRSVDVFFDQRLNKRLGKHSWGWWFETPSRSLWRHCNDYGRLCGPYTSTCFPSMTLNILTNDT